MNKTFEGGASMERKEKVLNPTGRVSQQNQTREGGFAMDREALIEQFVEYLKESLYYDFERSPRNWAKGLLVWLDEAPERSWGWSLASIMDIFLSGMEEWNDLEAEEREELAWDIYRRIEELAEEEEDWAGLSVEEWLELLKKELIKRKEIKDTDKWVLDLWENWLRYYIDRLFPYEILDIVFRWNPDWDWMPRKERRELAEKVINLIEEKLEEES
jgi:hypothetical protein